MRLQYTIDTFTPDAWEKTFEAFVTANKSHWKGAPHDAVIAILKGRGVFEFEVKGMNTWTCKFVLKILSDGRLDASFVPNEGMSTLMKKHLAKMQETFDRELRAYA